MPEDTPKTVKIQCPSCQTNLELDQDYFRELAGQVIDCPGCNGKVQVPTPPQSDTPTDPGYAGKRCPGCGIKLPANARFCLSCGTRIDPPCEIHDRGITTTMPVGPQRGIKLRRVILADQRKTCIGCGAELDANAVLCVSCGLNQRTGQSVVENQLSNKQMPPDPAPQTSIKNLALIVIGSAIFVLVGLWMIFSGEQVLLGIISVVFFGGCGIIGLLRGGRPVTSPVGQFAAFGAMGIIIVCLALYSGVFNKVSRPSAPSTPSENSSPSASQPTMSDDERATLAGRQIFSDPKKINSCRQVYEVRVLEKKDRHYILVGFANVQNQFGAYVNKCFLISIKLGDGDDFYVTKYSLYPIDDSTPDKDVLKVFKAMNDWIE